MPAALNRMLPASGGDTPPQETVVRKLRSAALRDAFLGHVLRAICMLGSAGVCRPQLTMPRQQKGAGFGKKFTARVALAACGRARPGALTALKRTESPGCRVALTTRCKLSGLSHRLQLREPFSAGGLSILLQFDSSRNAGGRPDRRAETAPKNFRTDG